MSDDPDIPAGAMLDQSEIDKLLASAGETARPALLRADGIHRIILVTRATHLWRSAH